MEPNKCLCGGSSKVHVKRRGNYRRKGDNYQVVCNSCRCRGPLSPDDRTAAVIKWNRMHNPSNRLKDMP